MTRDELIAEFRVQTQDRVGPDYLFETPWVSAWLAEAESEACLRGRLLHEAGNPELCELSVGPGDNVLTLHPALYELTHLAFKLTGATRREPLRLVSTEWLDGHVSDWRDLIGTPLYAVQGDTTLRLVPSPDAAGAVLLEGYRLPLSTTGAFEIHAAHHRHLLEWALFRAYSLPDAELYDPAKAAQAEQAFTDYFGARPDSDLRRITREDTEHHNKAWI